MKNQKLNNIRGEILGMEMEIKLMEDDLSNANMKIAYKNHLIEVIESNLLILKKKGVITSLINYKKAIEESKRLREQIGVLIQDRKQIIHKMELHSRKIETLYDKYEVLYSESNIIEMRKSE